MDEFFEVTAHFNRAYCNCEHDADQHGWMGCLVDDCSCEANWEE